MYSSPEQLEAIGHPGSFQPNRLNDYHRRDLTDKPFLAIDPPNPWEIDDAIHVTNRRQGGFVVQVAVAEGSQIDADDELIGDAIKRRSSNYAQERQQGSMLPVRVVDLLQLAHQTARRALVISQEFTADTEPTDHIWVEPALVAAEALKYKDFAKTARDKAANDEEPIVTFNRRFRAERQLPYRPTDRLETYSSLVQFGHNLVQTYMVTANLAFARWTDEQDVPILYRRFKFPPDTADERDEDEVIRATYGPRQTEHTSVAHFSRVYTPYTHVTSPLRRAADLVNHQQIGARLAGQELPFTTQDLLAISQRIHTVRSRKAKPQTDELAVAS